MNKNTKNYDDLYKDYIFIDEAGRGCAAGEMVFVGAKVTGDVSYADDSKKLSFTQRERLFNKVRENVQFCIVLSTANEIDEIGLSESIKKSLETIISYFGADELYLYDGNRTFGVDNPNLKTLVKADALVKGVGAASIIAKHTKDQLMIDHHTEYPMYNFINNSGYCTKDHIDAIKKHGYCEYHRKSYKIRALEEWKNKQQTDFLF